MKILIADDHDLVRTGLRMLLLDKYPGARIVEAGSTRDALAAVEAGPLDLAVVDINLPGRDGLEALREIKRGHPGLPVLVVSAHAEEEFALRALKMGASGYVSKMSASQVLVVAVEKVLRGGRYVSAAVAEHLARAAAEGWAEAPHEKLSSREMQVLKRIAAGVTVRKIAAELKLSEKTIATYRSRISEKLGLGTNVELTRYALQNHLVA